MTVAKAIRLREIILHGLNKKKTVLQWKKRVKASDAKKCSANWNGFTWVQKAVRLSIRNTLPVTKNFLRRAEKLSLRIHRFQFLPVLV